VGYTITAVDTTAEGHLYVVVDFGDGWIEDFTFAGLRLTETHDVIPTDEFGRWLTEDADEHLVPLTTDVDVLGIVRRTIEHHQAKGFSGWRVDTSVVLGGPDPLGLKTFVADALL
jgi:hypothetical protein